MVYVAAVNTIRGAIRMLTKPIGWTTAEADKWADGLIAISDPVGMFLAKWVVAGWRRIGAHGLADRVAKTNGLTA